MTPVLLALTAVAAPVVINDVRVEVGDGRVLDHATVVFERTIVAINGTVPTNATHVDGRGKVLAPGFIDVITTLGLSEVGAEGSTNDGAMAGSEAVPGFRVTEGFNPLSVRIPINRAAGITSAIAVPGGSLLHGTGTWFELTGALDSIPDPSRPAAMYASLNKDAYGGSRGAVWLRLREILADARFYLANRANHDRGASRKLALEPLHLEALQPVLGRDIPLVLYVDRAADILAALRFAKDQSIRLVLASAVEAWRIADQIAKAGVPVIMRPTSQVPDSFNALAARDDAATLLHQAGVRVLLSTLDDDNVRRLRQEAGIAVAYGLPRAEALRAITLSPAETFGRAKEIGSVAIGKSANLVLWSGDPLEISSQPEHIWINGVEQSLQHRQRQLADRYLKP